MAETGHSKLLNNSLTIDTQISVLKGTIVNSPLRSNNVSDQIIRRGNTGDGNTNATTINSRMKERDRDLRHGRIERSARMNATMSAE